MASLGGERTFNELCSTIFKSYQMNKNEKQSPLGYEVIIFCSQVGDPEDNLKNFRKNFKYIYHNTIVTTEDLFKLEKFEMNQAVLLQYYEPSIELNTPSVTLPELYTSFTKEGVLLSINHDTTEEMMSSFIEKSLNGLKEISSDEGQNFIYSFRYDQILQCRGDSPSLTLDLIDRSKRVYFKNESCCISYQIEWLNKPETVIFCSLYTDITKCMMEIKFFQSTIYDHCVKEQINNSLDALAKLKGSYDPNDCEIFSFIDKVKMINALDQLMSSNILDYLNDFDELAIKIKRFDTKLLNDHLDKLLLSIQQNIQLLKQGTNIQKVETDSFVDTINKKNTYDNQTNERKVLDRMEKLIKKRNIPLVNLEVKDGVKKEERKKIEVKKEIKKEIKQATKVKDDKLTKLKENAVYVLNHLRNDYDSKQMKDEDIEKISVLIENDSELLKRLVDKKKFKLETLKSIRLDNINEALTNLKQIDKQGIVMKTEKDAKVNHPKKEKKVEPVNNLKAKKEFLKVDSSVNDLKKNQKSNQIHSLDSSSSIDRNNPMYNGKSLTSIINKKYTVHDTNKEIINNNYINIPSDLIKEGLFINNSPNIEQNVLSILQSEQQNENKDKSKDSVQKKDRKEEEDQSKIQNDKNIPRDSEDDAKDKKDSSQQTNVDSKPKEGSYLSSDLNKNKKEKAITSNSNEREEDYEQNAAKPQSSNSIPGEHNDIKEDKHTFDLKDDKSSENGKDYTEKSMVRPNGLNKPKLFSSIKEKHLTNSFDNPDKFTPEDLDHMSNRENIPLEYITNIHGKESSPPSERDNDLHINPEGNEIGKGYQKEEKEEDPNLPNQNERNFSKVYNINSNQQDYNHLFINNDANQKNKISITTVSTNRLNSEEEAPSDDGTVLTYSVTQGELISDAKRLIDSINKESHDLMAYEKFPLT